MSVIEINNIEITGPIEMAPYEPGAIFNVAQRSRISPDDDGSLFGYATAVHNTTMIVGAYAKNNNRGSARAYRFLGGSWQLESEFTITDQQASALVDSNGSPRLGYAVAVWGDWAAVSATFSSYSGAVFLYQRVNGIWNNLPTQTISASQPGALFGAALDMRDNTLAIGHAAGFNGQGGVQIHVLTNNSWQQQGSTLTHLGDRAGPNQRFGTSVALGDNVVAAGGPGSSSVLSGTGAGEVFYATRTGNQWNSTRALVPATSSNDLFGASVAIRDKLLAVGAPLGNSTQQGRIFLYDLNAQTYQLQTILNVVRSGTGTITDASVPSNTRLGYSVSIDPTGSTIAAGAPGYNNYSGAIYVFERVAGQWTRAALGNSTSCLIGDNRATNRRLGVTVQFAAGGIVSGAPGSTTPGGAVYWFR